MSERVTWGQPPQARPAERSSQHLSDCGGETMKCEWVQENILLHIYNELPDDARYELEQHVARCTECAAELKAARQLHATLSQFPVQEPSPNLVAASRMRLQEALETTEQGGFWQRLVFDPGAWLRPIKLAPALAAAIFIVGFAGGIGATYQMMNGRNPVDISAAPLPQNLPSPAFSPSRRSLVPLRSASSTTQFPPRKRRDR